MSQPLAGRVALVTGASRGIGSATAIALAGLGAHVVLLARTQGGLEETDDAIRSAGGAASILPLDLLEGDKIDLIGPSLHARFGRLDILVHAAAALGKLTPVGHILPRDWADVVGVNLAATWRLIATADPLLRHSPAGRAVFFTDTPARVPAAYWGAYGATKAGMENLALSWAEEVRNTPIRANLVHPGVIGTRLRANAFPGINPTTWPLPETIGPAIATLCLPAETRHAMLIAL
jgi:NAD(P)-dependent dehydrogenase (short-subunit alcohol dehydrogenase family)